MFCAESANVYALFIATRNPFHHVLDELTRSNRYRELLVRNFVALKSTVILFTASLVSRHRHRRFVTSSYGRAHCGHRVGAVGKPLQVTKIEALSC
jgi:hypothetical protein